MVCIPPQSEPSCIVSATCINEGEHVDANMDGHIVMLESDEDLIIISLRTVCTCKFVLILDILMNHAGLTGGRLPQQMTPRQIDT